MTLPRLILKLSVLILISVFATLAPSFCLAQNKATHWIVLIHGLGGDESTWGHMADALTEQLQQIQPQYNIKIKTFVYPTGEKKLRTFDFAENYLGPFLSRSISATEMSANDKITLIGHSQGGIIAAIWYAEAKINSEALYDEKILADHVSEIITIGTPFWGSKLATRFTDNTRINWSKIAFLNTLAKFNQEELNDLSLGDNTEYQFRRTAIAASRKPLVNQIFSAKMTNISGVLPLSSKKLFIPIKELEDKSLYETFLAKAGRTVIDWMYSYFKNSKFGGIRPESDSAVMAPSSRINFIFADDMSESKNNFSFEDFHESNIFSDTEFVATESLHAPIDLSTQYGMASIPKDCINNRQCKHPTFAFILDAAANCLNYRCTATYITERKLLDTDLPWRKSSATVENTLQGYTIDITIRLPENYSLPSDLWRARSGPEDLSGEPFFLIDTFFERYVHFQTNRTEKMFPQNNSATIQVARQNEEYSKTAKFREISFRGKNHYDLRMTVTGLITKKNSTSQSEYKNALSKGFALPITIDLPGLKRKEIIAKIKPVYSTYIEYTADEK